MTNPFFTEILAILGSHGVDLLLVGGYAVAVHGRVRATEDLDLWVRPTPDNLKRLHRALEEYFDQPLSQSQAEQLRDPGFMVTFGKPPNLIDLHKEQPGVDFSSAWASREEVEFMGVTVFVVNREVLAELKRSSVPKREPDSPKYHTDLADLAWLERGEHG